MANKGKRKLPPDEQTLRNKNQSIKATIQHWITLLNGGCQKTYSNKCCQQHREPAALRYHQWDWKGCSHFGRWYSCSLKCQTVNYHCRIPNNNFTFRNSISKMRKTHCLTLTPPKTLVHKCMLAKEASRSALDVNTGVWFEPLEKDISLCRISDLRFHEMAVIVTALNHNVVRHHIGLLLGVLIGAGES